MTYGLWYDFPSEPVGDNLVYYVELSTSSTLGVTPVLYNITLYYIYCTPPSVTLTGQSVGDCFGWSVAGAGNVGYGVTGDTGIDDIIIGAPYRNSGTGTVYIFNGSATMASAISAANADYVRNGTQSGEHFGWSVDMAGDLDGNGYNDVIVGAPDKGPSSADGTGWAQVIVIPEFGAMLIAVFIPFGLSVIVFRRRRRRANAA